LEYCNNVNNCVDYFLFRFLLYICVVVEKFDGSCPRTIVSSASAGHFALKQHIYGDSGITHTSARTTYQRTLFFVCVLFFLGVVVQADPGKKNETEKISEHLI
jgi:hypothetical protein